MQHIGDLLNRSGVGEEESFQAAAVLAVVNAVLHEELSATPAEVRAVAYQHRQIIIRVSHGAAAGMIRADEKNILDIIRRRLSDRWPKHTPTIERLAFRRS